MSETLRHPSLSTFSAPFFIKHLPRTIEVMEGTNVRLDCILRGGVELVQWSQEGADQSKRDFESEGFEGDFVSMGDRPQGAASKPSGKSTGGGWFKPFNPFTAPACKISGLENAHMHLQTAYIPVL